MLASRCKLKRESTPHGGVSHELVPDNSLTDSSRAKDYPGFYTVLKQHGHLSSAIQSKAV